MMVRIRGALWRIALWAAIVVYALLCAIVVAGILP